MLGLWTLPWNSGSFKWVTMTDCKFVSAILYNSIFLHLLRMKKSILNYRTFYPVLTKSQDCKGGCMAA